MSQSTLLSTKTNGQLFSLFSFLWNVTVPIHWQHCPPLTLDLLQKGGEMTSRAEGWRRVFLMVLHTMWRWDLTWSFLPFSKTKWMYLNQIQPLRWGNQSWWFSQPSYFLKSHREIPLREISVFLWCFFSLKHRLLAQATGLHIYKYSTCFLEDLW